MILYFFWIDHILNWIGLIFNWIDCMLNSNDLILFFGLIIFFIGSYTYSQFACHSVWMGFVCALFGHYVVELRTCHNLDPIFEPAYNRERVTVRYTLQETVSSSPVVKDRLLLSLKVG